jgi:hypothetical protein
MKHYHDWLKTLSTNQLADLRGKPEAERVDYIKRIVAEQQQKAWRKLAEQASAEDLETVFDWLKEFVQKHRDQLAPGDLGRRLAKVDKDRQALILIHFMQSSRFPGAVRPGKTEVEALIPRLSPEAQKFFNKTTDLPRRIQLISIWSRAAWWSKAFPNVTSEQLAAFFEKLQAEERDRLEMLPIADRDSELRLLYARANFMRRGELGGPWDPRDNRGPWRGGPGGKSESPRDESGRRPPPPDRKDRPM